MIEVRFHGRGGQGVKMAAKVLARAAYLSGFKTQDFAIYGAERQGAPLTSFVRIDKNRIMIRGYVFEPDYIIILDETLDEKETLKGLKAKTRVFVNTEKKLGRKNFFGFDATSVALKEIGKPLVNIAMLGAFVKKTNLVEFEKLEQAIEIELEKYSKELVQKNINAAKKCFELMK